MNLETWWRRAERDEWKSKSENGIARWEPGILDEHPLGVSTGFTRRYGWVFGTISATVNLDLRPRKAMKLASERLSTLAHLCGVSLEPPGRAIPQNGFTIGARTLRGLSGVCRQVSDALSR